MSVRFWVPYCILCSDMLPIAPQTLANFPLLFSAFSEKKDFVYYTRKGTFAEIFIKNRMITCYDSLPSQYNDRDLKNKQLLSLRSFLVLCF